MRYVFLLALFICLLPVPGMTAEVVAEQPLEAALEDVLKPVMRRDKAYLKQHEDFVQQAAAAAVAKTGAGAAAGIDLLFIGDSITHGWTTHGEAMWQQYFVPLRAANFGILGDKVQFMHARLQAGELQGIAPRLVVVMAGTNNIKGGPTRMPPEAVAQGVAAMVVTIRTALPEAQVLVLGLLPRQPEYDWIDAAIRDTNTRLAAFTQTNDQLYFLDVGDVFRDQQGALRLDLMPDALHPNAEGYAAWAKVMLPTVRALLANE